MTTRPAVYDIKLHLEQLNRRMAERRRARLLRTARQVDPDRVETRRMTR